MLLLFSTNLVQKVWRKQWQEKLGIITGSRFPLLARRISSELWSSRIRLMARLIVCGLCTRPNLLLKTNPVNLSIVSLHGPVALMGSFRGVTPWGFSVGSENFIFYYEKREGYYYSGGGIFVSFARLLSKYKEPIINSFVIAEKYGPSGLYNSRLSNGPIESMNRKIKDLKRLGRGYNNFEHFRNRFLYAARSCPILDATGNDDQVQYYEDDDK